VSSNTLSEKPRRQSSTAISIAGSVGLFVALGVVGIVLSAYRPDFYWSGYLSMVFFYCVMFYLGISARSTDRESLGDMLLAGRSLPLGIALLTMTATWVGGGFVNGTAEYVAGSGLAWAQAPWGYALSLILGGLIFAGPMRRRNYTTMLDPLADRFGQRMAAVLYLPALLGEVFWTAAILTALGTTFGYILDLPFNLSIIISALVAIMYTSLGGLRSVAYTDVLQLIVVIIGLGLAIPFVVPVDGWGELWKAYEKRFAEAAYPWPSRSWGNTYYLWWDYALLLIFGGIPWHVYFQRVLSSESEQTARRLSIGAGVLCFVAALPAAIIGLVCATTDWQTMGLSGPDTDAIALPYVLKHLTPPLVATIGLGALAAAVMSSVDSSILSASSMGTWNVYRPWSGNQDDERKLQTMVRRLIWIIGIAATLLALQIQSVYELWFLCSDFVYCILFAQLVTALFDPRANSYGSLAGFIVATTLRLGAGEPSLGLPQWLHYPMLSAEGVIEFPFRTTSMLAGLFTIVLVSRLTGRQNPPRPLHTRLIDPDDTNS